MFRTGAAEVGRGGALLGPLRPGGVAGIKALGEALEGSGEASRDASREATLLPSPLGLLCTQGLVNRV